MKATNVVIAGAALAFLTACGGRDSDSSRMAADTALLRDLNLATQPYQPFDSVSALEQQLTADSSAAALGYSAATAAPVQRQPTSTANGPRRTTSSTGTARSSSGTRTTTVSGGTVAQPAGREVIVKNTKRDAAIGAAAGAAIGAATSKDKVKGAVIGGAAGAIIGGVIGNNVDVQKKRVP
jgi:hypothetical protein